MMRPTESQNSENTEEAHLKTIEFYREKMDLQPLHSALKSFNIDAAARMSGVYEIYRCNKVIFIGGNPYLSNILDCLNAHFSGNDGLPVGAYLSGPGRRKWKKMSVRWMSVPNSHEVAYYLLEDYQRKNGQLPLYNNPVIVDDSAGSDSE